MEADVVAPLAKLSPLRQSRNWHSQFQVYAGPHRETARSSACDRYAQVRLEQVRAVRVAAPVRQSVCEQKSGPARGARGASASRSAERGYVKHLRKRSV